MCIIYSICIMNHEKYVDNDKLDCYPIWLNNSIIFIYYFHIFISESRNRERVRETTDYTTILKEYIYNIFYIKYWCKHKFLSFHYQLVAKQYYSEWKTILKRIAFSNSPFLSICWCSLLSQFLTLPLHFCICLMVNKMYKDRLYVVILFVLIALPCLWFVVIVKLLFNYLVK